MKASIDKRGNFQVHPFFDKHKNHEFWLVEKKYDTRVEEINYRPYYQVDKHPLRIISYCDKYQRVDNDYSPKSVRGIYKCEIPNCSAKIFIDKDGKFHNIGKLIYYGSQQHNFEELHQRKFSGWKPNLWDSESKCKFPLNGNCYSSCPLKSMHMENKKFESIEELKLLAHRTLDRERFIGKLKWKLKEFH